MYIKSIRIKNFLSYGERPVEYIFDRHKTTLITGTNGEGKSVIIDALTFAFYGKPFREIKKELLINVTNKKNTLIECDLIGNNGKEVMIRRGIKPNVFEIYEDGTLVDQNAESRDYQSYLEQNIIGMNFIIFSQTVIISKTRYTPFMKLKAAERRQFVESILDIEIFGDMSKLQNRAVALLKEEETKISTNIRVDNTSFSNKIDSLKKFISMVAQAKEESEKSNNTEIDIILDKIDILKESNASLGKIVDKTDYTEGADKYTKLKNKLSNVVQDARSMNNELNKLKSASDECHVCGGAIDISHVKKHEDDINVKLEENSVLHNKIVEAMEKYVGDFNNDRDQSEKNRHIQSEIRSNSNMISAYEKDVSRLRDKKYDATQYDGDINGLKSEIKNLKSVLEQHNDDLKNKLVEIDNNVFAASLLKDSGVKAAIIQNRIPNINRIINEYLHKFGFYIMFELDSEFNETIYVRGVSHLTYNSFSEGEKLRIDLALILAWREIALMQSGLSCNLLFFDEITDASLDIEGVELFMKSLAELKNVNTWIISHAPEKIEGYVRGHVNLHKVDGFTTITQTK